MGYNISIKLNKAGYARPEDIAQSIRSIMASTTGLDTIIKINDVTLNVRTLPREANMQEYTKINKNNAQIQNKTRTNTRK